jgi:hypothetical protein
VDDLIRNLEESKRYIIMATFIDEHGILQHNVTMRDFPTKDLIPSGKQMNKLFNTEVARLQKEGKECE